MVDTSVAEGLTRRQAVKGGAAVGATLLWSTPVVQALSVRVADAASPGGSIQPQSCNDTAQGDGIVVFVSGKVLAKKLPVVSQSFADSGVCGIGTAQGAGTTSNISDEGFLFLEPLASHSASEVTSTQSSNNTVAYVKALELILPTPSPTVITATLLQATANTVAGASGGTSAATSSIGSLSISGTPIAIADPGAPQEVSLGGLGTIYLNQKSAPAPHQSGTTWSAQATATVLRIVLGGGDTAAEIIVSRANSTSTFTS